MSDKNYSENEFYYPKLEQEDFDRNLYQLIFLTKFLANGSGCILNSQQNSILHCHIIKKP